MGTFANVLTGLSERGLMPDAFIRRGIRALLAQRLDSLDAGSAGADSDSRYRAFIRKMDSAPVATGTDEANRQHYELPPAYFDFVLGRRKKYSCCYWDRSASTLDRAEESALAKTCEQAGIADGQRILELGCGWGSLTLWMAECYPCASITAVSNSASQKKWIDRELDFRGLNNVEVITADMNRFDSNGGFHRVVSVEMFEHMRNWRVLFSRVTRWLEDDGRFFMHVFCHRNLPYFFEVGEDNDWMSRHFFSGGMMPSFQLPSRFDEQLTLENHWSWNGDHYARTLAAWLQNHDNCREEILAIFTDVYGDAANIWYSRWRLFYLACEELFRYNGGDEWFVGQYLLRKREC